MGRLQHQGFNRSGCGEAGTWGSPELLAQATGEAVAPLTPGGNEDFSVETEMSGRGVSKRSQKNRSVDQRRALKGT